MNKFKLPYLTDSFNAKMMCFGERAMEYAHVKILFSFFLSIIYTHSVAHQQSWSHDTLPCVLIYPVVALVLSWVIDCMAWAISLLWITYIWGIAWYVCQQSIHIRQSSHASVTTIIHTVKFRLLANAIEQFAQMIARTCELFLSTKLFLVT